MNKSVLMTIIVLLIIFAVITIAAEVILFLTSNGHANLDFAIKNSKKSEHEKLRDELRRRDWEWLQKQKTEEYFINSNDGLRLRALYLLAPEGEGSNRLAFCIHGIQSNGTREFVTAARYFYEHGIGSFIIDQRACGKSEGRYVTYGCREAGDCLLWLDFIKAEFGADMRVFVYGMSMGGTITVLLGGSRLPENVEYLVADCGYASVRKQMYFTFASLKLPHKLFYALYKCACLVHGIYNPDMVYIMQAAKACKLPVLFIHGNSDKVVPVENVHELYEACGSEDKRLLVNDGIGHVQSFAASEQVREAIIAGMSQ